MYLRAEIWHLACVSFFSKSFLILDQDIPVVKQTLSSASSPSQTCEDLIAAGPVSPLPSYIFPYKYLPLRFFLHVLMVLDVYFFPSIPFRSKLIKQAYVSLSLLLYLLGYI